MYRISYFNRNTALPKLLLRGIGLYIFWLVFRSDFLGIYSYVNELLLNMLQVLGIGFVRALGYPTFTDGRNFGISGSTGVFLGEPCNGLLVVYVSLSFFLAIT